MLLKDVSNNISIYLCYLDQRNRSIQSNKNKVSVPSITNQSPSNSIYSQQKAPMNSNYYQEQQPKIDYNDYQQNYTNNIIPQMQGYYTNNEVSN